MHPVPCNRGIAYQSNVKCTLFPPHLQTSRRFPGLTPRFSLSRPGSLFPRPCLKHAIVISAPLSCFTSPASPCLKHAIAISAPLSCFTSPTDPCLKHAIVIPAPLSCFTTILYPKKRFTKGAKTALYGPARPFFQLNVSFLMKRITILIFVIDK